MRKTLKREQIIAVMDYKNLPKETLGLINESAVSALGAECNCVVISTEGYYKLKNSSKNIMKKLNKSLYLRVWEERHE